VDEPASAGSSSGSLRPYGPDRLRLARVRSRLPGSRLAFRCLFAFAFSAIPIAACNEAQPADEGAAFRAVARKMYASLGQPSCKPPGGFERRNDLAEPIADVAALEARLQSVPAWSHLAIAREDARHEIEQDKSCWSDTSRDWAVRHVEMTKADVAAALPMLQSEAPTLTALHTGDSAPAEAPAFRYLARQLLAYVRPLCPVSTSLSNDEAFAPARESVERLRDDLAGTPFAAHLAIAEADASYEASQTIVECGLPSAENGMQLRTRLGREAERKIIKIRKLVNAIS